MSIKSDPFASLTHLFGQQAQLEKRAEMAEQRARRAESERDQLKLACEVALNSRMYKEWPEVADLLKAALGIES